MLTAINQSINQSSDGHKLDWLTYFAAGPACHSHAIWIDQSHNGASATSWLHFNFCPFLWHHI